MSKIKCMTDNKSSFDILTTTNVTEDLQSMLHGSDKWRKTNKFVWSELKERMN